MRCRALLVVLLALLHAGAARAADDSVLRFCFVEWRPYVWSTGAGEVDGITADILREAARRSGLVARFAEMPWKRCLTEVERGNLDAAMDGAPRPEYAVGRHSVVSSYYAFWVRSADYLQGGSDPARLDGRRISLVHGWWYPPSLRAAAPALDVVELDSEENQLRGLALGRQDAAYGDLITMRVQAERLKLAVRPLLPAHTAVSFYPLFHRGRPEQAARIDAALGAMLADGSVDAIYRRHLGLSLADLARQAGPLPAR